MMIKKMKMKAELMKKIDGFDKYYISKTGVILDTDYDKTKMCKLLKLQSSVEGYKIIQLTNNGKIFNKRVHRLVAETYIPNPDNLPQVNHKDEDKANNNVDNLEWCSAKYNSNYGTRTERVRKKRNKKVLAYNLNGDFLFELESASYGKKLGFSQGHISACCRGERKTHKNIIWKLADNKDNNKDNE